MDIPSILKQLDSLLHACRLDEAEAFLCEVIQKAKTSGDTDAEKTLLNEQMGFYRDCGRFPEMLDTAAKARSLFEQQGETNSIAYGTTLLNCANAYRAAGVYAKAFSAYETVQKLYNMLLPPSDGRIASLWNNLALLYQETGQWEQACRCLEQALTLVRQHAGDETRTAISCTNLAVSLLRLHRVEDALAYLMEADGILAGRAPSDFHYSATLAGFGDAYYQMGNYDKAAAYYEKALPEIELHMGQNNFYTIVSDNLAQTYEKLGTERPRLSGLELSRRFYEDFGAPMLERSFGGLLPRLAVGLAGEGSECLGYDDALSQDHDFGPGFCIWVPDDLPEEVVQQLKSAYDTLPKSYHGIRRLETSEADGRVGVCTVGGYFRRLLGLPGVPRTPEEWLTVDESMLAAACSGELFRDDGEIMTTPRRKLLLGYPRSVWLRRLAQALGRMAQCGQYNFVRMRRRGEPAAAQLYLAEFCRNAMNAAHLLRGVYAPYEKWLLRSTAALEDFGEMAEQIRALLLLPPRRETDFDEETDPACVYIREICEKIGKETAMANAIEQPENAYLADTAKALGAKAEETEAHQADVEKIVRLEWETFDSVQNVGGRAACQDDWETFSIMRRSQYLPWDGALLKQWIAAFEQACSEGRNLITEKYARMMESTHPEEYAKIKDQLPPVSPEFMQLREAIISIQIPWMEAFAAQYPNLAARARIIHTEDDSPWETSYETYLRGELTVYPFEVLYGYGRWIVSLHQQGKNLSRMILEETVHEYGYATLEEAEQNGCCP